MAEAAAAAKSALTGWAGAWSVREGPHPRRTAFVPEARIIVVGNEKGGAGKSTVLVHLSVALLHDGARVAIIDLDRRQLSTAHFFASRAAWAAANPKAILPMPEVIPLAADDSVEAGIERALAAEVDFIIIDTPGADTADSRAAHGRADLIVTPMNDSFVDFDVLGVVDPVSLQLKRPSLYAEAVWEARKVRAASRGASIDWVVLRNRLASVEPRNRKRVDERVAALSRRVGFRIAAGLRDRVIYRELFPFGLTVSDLGPTVKPIPVSLGHVAGRQELRALMSALGLSGSPAIAAE
jgi:chromosome partitioning protein